MIKEDILGKTFYKYRSLEGENFERFVDIIYKNRLFGASYKDLNDPMEGRYERKDLKTNDFKEINGYLKRSLICSFSEKQDNQDFPDNYMMWSHYADGHRGCCIEFKCINDNKNEPWCIDNIQYDNDIYALSTNSKIENDINTFLFHKTEDWANEREYRAIKHYEKGENVSPYFYVKINAVYFGVKHTKKQIEYYKTLIKKINKNIKVFRIQLKNNYYDKNSSFLKKTEV